MTYTQHAIAEKRIYYQLACLFFILREVCTILRYRSANVTREVKDEPQSTLLITPIPNYISLEKKYMLNNGVAFKDNSRYTIFQNKNGKLSIHETSEPTE